MSKWDAEDSANLGEFRQSLRDHLPGELPEIQGLRERKKTLMRQLISDTATLLFLERGFDEVTISEIAAACDVSEKTIYNYFPTKESLLLDREEESAQWIRRALGPGAEHVSPTDAVVKILSDEMDRFVSQLDSATDVDFHLILRFNDLIESTPALKAARADMMDRLAQVAAEALAARAAVDPNDPEPQIAADALLGLWHIYYRAIIKYSNEGLPLSGIRDAVMNDVRRAGRLIDTGLWSFATVVQGESGRQQFKAASDASIEARRQVMNAIKEARDAWRVLKTEVESRGREERDSMRRTHEQMHRDAQEIKRLAQRQRQELKQAVKQARKSGRPKSS
ncbi:MAG: helix-turn-helix domain-containing protein [Acidimicrobiales bacterium]